MRRLLKGLLCLALVLEVKAEVHRYDVTQYPLQTIGTYLELPAEIVGTLSVKDGRQTVAFQTRANYGEVPVAIYTYSGTGAVFKATLVWFHEDFQEPIAVSGTEKRIPIDSVSHYELIIENDQFRSGAQYVVRIGEFEPLTVKFNGNGGELSETQKVYSPGQPYGEFPAVISLLGRRFDGWATAEANGIVLATNTVVCVGYTNLYAQWSDGIDPLEPTKPVPVVTNYVVKFNANGGSGSMTTQTFTYGEAKALSTNLFERSTYDFDGWATSATGKVVYADGEVVSNLTKKINDVVPLYAHWTRATNVYDVAFNANGGLGTMPVQTFYIDQAQALTTNLFIRVGYDFAGWSTSATGTAVYADCQVVSNLDATLDKTLTLYAQWNIKPLQIHSNVVDGITWFFSVDNGTASIINIVGREYGVAVEPQTVASLKVPEILTEGTNDYSVTAIGENAFKGLTLLTEVAIPVSVSVISANAFAGCGNIVSATLPMTMPISSVMPDSCKTIKHVKVPGVEEFLDDEVSICEGAFSGCASLESVTLPLGLTELPTSTFDGCSGLVSFEMPYTVTSIGERAFAGCSSLTAITVTENVEEIGANAFTDCSGLKVVRYLGDQPEAETGGANNIYYHSNAALVSGCLPSLRNWPAAASWGEGDASSSTNGVAHEYNPAIWPEGGAGKPLVTWNNKMYQFRTVTLDYNGGSTQKTNHICVAGRVMGVLPEVESDGFVGWFTEKYGGVEVSPYTVVQSSITVFAHWADYGGTRGIVAPFDAFYENDDSFSYAATTFEGVLLKDEKVAGIIQLKTKKGLFVASADGSNSNFTAAMQVLGSKKVTMSGTIGADGSASVEDERKGLALDLEVTRFGLSGTYATEEDAYEIVGARNRYSAGSDDAQNRVRAALANAGRNWTIVLPTDDAEGNGASLASGYSVLSVSVGAKGKSRIRGTMADGTKVSASSTLLVGDSCCCLPVVVPLYPGKKGGFAFAIWFTWTEDMSESEMSVVGLSSWDATADRSASFSATFGSPVVGVAGASSVPTESTFNTDDFFDFDGVNDAFSPDGTEIVASQSRWTLPKSDSVKFSKEEGWYTPDGKDYGNPAGLKLTYTAETGFFKGSFRVFAEPRPGKSKKYTATVMGAVVDGVGYGTATVKKIGNLSVRVE